MSGLHRLRTWAEGQELRAVVAPLLITVAVWGFWEIAEVASAETAHALDEKFLMLLREHGDGGDPVGPEWLEEMARDVTALGSVALLGLMLAASAGFLLLQRKFRTVLFVLVTIPGGIALSFILKNSFDRPRPGLVAHEVQTFTSSFPSAHSMAAAITFLTLGAVLARTQTSRVTQGYLMTVAALLTFLVGFSRIYLGVHWPTDVLGGWIGGAAWSLMCWLVARSLQGRGTIEEAGECSARPVAAATS